MWRLNDLFGYIPAHPAELLSVAALQHLEQIRERSRKIVEADRVLLNDFLSQETRVSAAHTKFGTTSFLGLKNGDVEVFLQKLLTQYETSVVSWAIFRNAQPLPHRHGR